MTNMIFIDSHQLLITTTEAIELHKRDLVGAPLSK
jgi:hypothetical protein